MLYYYTKKPPYSFTIHTFYIVNKSTRFICNYHSLKYYAAPNKWTLACTHTKETFTDRLRGQLMQHTNRECVLQTIRCTSRIKCTNKMQKWSRKFFCGGGGGICRNRCRLRRHCCPRCRHLRRHLSLCVDKTNKLFLTATTAAKPRKLDIPCIR